MTSKTIGEAYLQKFFEDIKIEDFFDIEPEVEVYFNQYIKPNLEKYNHAILNPIVLAKIYRYKFEYMPYYYFYLLFYADISMRIFNEGYMVKNFLGKKDDQFIYVIKYEKNDTDISKYKRVLDLADCYFEYEIIPAILETKKENNSFILKNIPNHKPENVSEYFTEFSKILNTIFHFKIILNLLEEDIFIKNVEECYSSFVINKETQDYYCFVSPKYCFKGNEEDKIVLYIYCTLTDDILAYFKKVGFE